MHHFTTAAATAGRRTAPGLGGMVARASLSRAGRVAGTSSLTLRPIHTAREFPETDPVPKPIYRGAMNNAVKVLKFFSVSSLGLSSIGLPLSMTMIDSAILEKSAAAAFMLSPNVMIGVTIFSSLSTLAAHKFLAPYVTRVFLLPGPDGTRPGPTDPITPNTTLSIETLTLLNQKRYTTLQMKELAYSPKATITWEAAVPGGADEAQWRKANPYNRFMILLRKSGMTTEMRNVLSFMSGKYRLLTMTELTQRALLKQIAPLPNRRVESEPVAESESAPRKDT
ncbi:hypothetical protein H9P43_000770 [Blastocladiella emersonii ATCC 22665]|nr:hypothetical protein H9P43_000770 [Blastocladiella emersonii ATCC 22665]